MTAPDDGALRVGIGGLGTIGLPVAKWLDSGVEGLTLTAVSAADKERAQERVAGLKTSVPVVGLDELAEHADIVLESVPPERFLEIAEIGRAHV